jgi:hypothetical protein
LRPKKAVAIHQQSKPSVVPVARFASIDEGEIDVSEVVIKPVKSMR